MEDFERWGVLVPLFGREDGGVEEVDDVLWGRGLLVGALVLFVTGSVADRLMPGFGSDVGGVCCDSLGVFVGVVLVEGVGEEERDEGLWKCDERWWVVLERRMPIVNCSFRWEVSMRVEFREGSICK